MKGKIWNGRARLVLAALILTASLGVTASASASGAALSRALMGTPRSELGVAAGPDGRIYAIGGTKASGGVTSTVEAYSPGTDTWSYVQSLPTIRTGLAAATGTDGKIYAIGGNTCGINCTLGDVTAYNTKTNTWTTVARMPSDRTGLAAAAGLDGTIYAIGGYYNDSNPPASEVDAYNTTTNTWTTVASLPNGRAYLAATAGKDGKIYAIGGIDAGCACTTSMTAYDPATNTWKAVAPLPYGREDLSAATGTDGRIYVFGGKNLQGGATDAVDAYNPATNTWSLGATAGLHISGGAAAIPSGALYVVGGLDQVGGAATGLTEVVTDDVTAPTVTKVPGQHFNVPSQLATVTVPVAEDFAASDAGTGVCTYRVAESVNGGTYQLVYAGSAKTTVRSLTPANTYQYSVSAMDCVGNQTAQQPSHAFTVNSIVEGSAKITYTGTWTLQSDANAYGGYERYTTGKNASASYTVKGRNIAWIAPTGPTRGAATVTIDGVSTTINLHTTSARARQVVFKAGWGTVGTHTIKIANQATAGHPRIDLDGFITIT